MKPIKATYRGSSSKMHYGYEYDIVRVSDKRFQVRNDNDKLEWYSGSSFCDVVYDKQAETNKKSSTSISEIQSEINKATQHLAELNKKLKQAKKSENKNIILRAFENVDDDFAFDELVNGLVDCVEQLSGNFANLIEFPLGLTFDINTIIGGIILDRDYQWKIVEEHGRQVLQVWER